MDHAKKDKELDKEELSACCKKLESHVNHNTNITLKKTLTPKELQGILQNILDMNFTFDDLKNVKLGPILKNINTEFAKDAEYKAVRDIVGKIGEKAKQAKNLNGAKPTEKTSESKKEEKSVEKAEKKIDTDFTSINLDGVDSLPKLEPSNRNYIVKTIVENLLIDYKNDAKGLEGNRKIANKVAINIEEYLFNKMEQKVDGDYRNESMSILAYIKDKPNQDLRTELLRGTDVKVFVDKKESFLNIAARERLEKLNRRILDANDADYHKKLVNDSLIYSCRKCKSKKILKEEKQIRGGDEPMTSFFTCLECGGGWREG